MTYYLGSVVRVSTEVRDGAGVLTNATVVCEVTSPLGVVTTPPVNNPGPGLYNADVALPLAGPAGTWVYRFVSTGAVVGVDAGQFFTEPAAERIVGLAEVKAHGNITTTTDDGEINDLIETSRRIVEHLVGPVVPRTVVEQHGATYGILTTSRRTLWLLRPPIASITSVVERLGSTPQRTLTSAEYQVDEETGELRRVTTTGASALFGGDNVLVTYVAGVNDPAVRSAAKELTIHLYRRSQVLRGGRRAGPADGETTTIMGYAVPNAVIQELAHRRVGPRVY